MYSLDRNTYNNINFILWLKYNRKGVRALRGYFGPLWSQKLKVAFHQIHIVGLLKE